LPCAFLGSSHGFLETEEAKVSSSRKGIARTVGYVVLAVVVLIQFVPYGRDHDNPPVGEEPEWSDSATRTRFLATCGDCHSNQTRWPWYSHVAPASWLIQRDVEKARAEFNVSEWGRPNQEGDEAAEELREGEMPLWFYVILHPDAKLDDAEKTRFLSGLIATFGEEEHDHSDHHD
jgi:hypothetical protein